MDHFIERLQRDRRLTRRRDVKARLRVHVWKSAMPEHRAESVNLSERGVFFATDCPMRKGEMVELLFKMPEEITGMPTTEWRCMGHVVRVEAIEPERGRVGVGIQFDFYEVSRPQQLLSQKASTLSFSSLLPC